MKTREKKRKSSLLFSVLLVLAVLLCGCDSKDTEQTVTPTDMPTVTPTVLPGIPPYYVMLDGTLMQIKEAVEGDFSEYQVGTFTYTGDLFDLPKEDGQTNFCEYDGSVYAFKDDVWYIYTYWRKGSWCRLGPDE